MKSLILLALLLHTKLWSLSPKILVEIPQNHSEDFSISQRIYRELLFQLSKNELFNPLSHDEVLWKLDSLGDSYWTTCLTQSCYKNLGDKLGTPLIITTTIQPKAKNKIITLKILHIKNESPLFSDQFKIENQAKIDEFISYWMGLRMGTTAEIPQLPKGISYYQEDLRPMYYSIGAELLVGAMIFWNYLDLFVGDNQKGRAVQYEDGSYGSLSSYRGFFSQVPEGTDIKSRGRGAAASSKSVAGVAHNPALAYQFNENTWQIFKQHSDYGPPGLFIGFASNIAPVLYHAQSLFYIGDELSSEWTFRSTWTTDLSSVTRLTEGVRLGITIKSYMATTKESCPHLNCSSGKSIGFGEDIGIIAQPHPHLKWGLSIEDPFAFLWHHNTATNVYYQEELTTRWRVGLVIDFDQYEIHTDWIAKKVNFETNRMSLGISGGPKLFRFSGGAYLQPGSLGGAALTAGVASEFEWDDYSAEISWATEFPIEGLYSRNGNQVVELGLRF